MLIENAVLAGVESRCRHFHRDRDSYGVGDALAKRTGRTLHSRRLKKFRMARRFRMQLAETFDLRHWQIVAAHMEPGVKKHAAVTGREDEVIAPDPTGLIGIV